MRVWCHVALEERKLGTWEVKCHATLMHEHGSGRVRGMENTWPSNGHVSNRFEGVLHPKPILFDGKEVGEKRKRERKERIKERKKEREKKKGKKKKGKKRKDIEKGKERERRGAVQDFCF